MFRVPPTVVPGLSSYLIRGGNSRETAEGHIFRFLFCILISMLLIVVSMQCPYEMLDLNWGKRLDEGSSCCWLVETHGYVFAFFLNSVFSFQLYKFCEVLWILHQSLLDNNLILIKLPNDENVT